MIQKTLIYSMAIGVAVGFAIAQFIYQLFTEQDWVKATVRSFFGAGGIAALCISIGFVH